ncbi:NTP transferase domain-containing protein [Marinobacter sp. AN1]|uniref:nucleotidyltransferase family protein n=1 Tax=Marinobacter sp. AN1 TaxID=2886046 RepID=UPI00222E6958|nr:nucleotidyltransferase family protein [Marinobacter sp. AN1]UZD64593.1 nucleotidyltransferase family protein [Marinobacter sp. AN1]
MADIAALILAGGASSRFGGCKLLAEIDGRNLLQRSIELASGVLPGHVHVVTGAWHPQLMAAKAEGRLCGAEFIHATNWSEGMAASLRAGINNLTADYRAVLVLLADQVALTRADLAALLEAFDGHNIACGVYGGRRGVPAVFPRSSFPRLGQLGGDQGAKAVLYESTVPVRECSMPNAQRDIDTPEQLGAWQGSGAV